MPSSRDFGSVVKGRTIGCRLGLQSNGRPVRVAADDDDSEGTAGVLAPA